MALEGLASAQARISAIQDKINSLSNNGRPPVSITESSGSTSNTQSVNTSSSAFATEMAKQVASANLSSSTPTTAAGQVQGIPGTAEAFLEKVRSYIGVPYVWGGTDPNTGLDCSGLVQTAARDVGVNLPRVTYDQRHAGIEVNGIKNARPGDLIITNNSGHVVVYAGNGRIIHAPRPGLKVQEAPLSDAGEIVTIRRVMRSASDSPAVQSSKVSAQASVAASAANLAQNGGLAALLGANSSLAATGLGAASGKADLANALLGALSGTSTTGRNTGTNSALSSLLASAGSATRNSGYNATLLSQFMGSSASASGSNAGLAALVSGVDANSLTSTASALNSVSTLRSALGV